MKHFITPFLLLLFLKNAFAQDYQVRDVQGHIYDGNTLLADNAWIKKLDKLSASTPNAAIRLVSTKYGPVVISFSNGQKVTKVNKSEKSEFYELVVQDYIDKYNHHKETGVLGVPQEYDWYSYFYQYPDTVQRKMLIVEGQKIPFQSRVFPKTRQAFEIFARISTGKGDTVSYELPVKQDSISFPASAFLTNKRCLLDIYLGFEDKSGHNKTVEVTKQPIEICYMTKQDLKDLMGMFNKNSNNSKTNSIDAKSDLYSYLEFNYVRFYYPLIETQADQIFK